MTGAKRFIATLPDTQAAVFWLLQHGHNVAITRLYRRFRTDTPRSPRHEQQAVGAVISRLNQRLAPLGYIVKPGEQRRTYRLIQSAR